MSARRLTCTPLFCFLEGLKNFLQTHFQPDFRAQLWHLVKKLLSAFMYVCITQQRIKIGVFSPQPEHMASPSTFFHPTATISALATVISQPISQTGLSIWTLAPCLVLTHHNRDNDFKI